ncbi:DUF4465 domain-containing protein [Myroides injenensis]|uniref:DUF4465 domain-containing protein n=1 Tax=Myroides injenensis TaxID=1183151 RepID=UPI0002894CC9|nr:DUF4465 domain-containing protein [Myroides injenensis]
MKKSIYNYGKLFLLGIAIVTSSTFTSCSSDDNVPYSIPIIKDQDQIKVIAKESFTIDPKIEEQDAKYIWYQNDNVISNERILHHTINVIGEYKITLKVVTQKSITLYNYSVLVEKNIDYNYITLDLTNFDLSDGIETTGGRIWKDTYSEDIVIKSGIFEFNHVAWPDMYTWMGFTVSNSNDNQNHFISDDGWIPNQWGTMPKGGIKGMGTPFLVSYADHKPNAKLLQPNKELQLERFSAVVRLDDSARYKAISTSLAISPWPYYGILNGDSFARKFEVGDYFAIHIYGVGKDKKLTSENPVTHYFVDFRKGINEINTGWSDVDLTALGEVEYLVFFLETTDVGDWGANTALYFTMDALTVDKIED